MSSPDIIISIVILAAVAAAVVVGRREGQQNPVGTGKLQRDVTALRGDLKKAQADIAQIRSDLDKAPSSAEIAVLRTEIEASRREMALVIKSADRTEEAVVRIEQYLLKGHGA